MARPEDLTTHVRGLEEDSQVTRVGGMEAEDSQATRVPSGDASGDDSIELLDSEAVLMESSDSVRVVDPTAETRVRLEFEVQQTRVVRDPTLEVQDGQILPDDQQTRVVRSSASVPVFLPLGEPLGQPLGGDSFEPEYAAYEPASYEVDAEAREGSVVQRIVQSVVAALPKAIKKAVSRRDNSKVIPVERPESSSANRLLSGIDARSWRELRTSPIFDGLPNEALRDAMLSGDAAVLRLERDSLVPLDGPSDGPRNGPRDGSVGLVRTGQVALALFNNALLAVERRAALEVARAGGKIDKKERKRRNQAGPLIRVAEKNLATFEEGDVVETAAAARDHATLACYTVTPTVIITMARSRVDLWKRIYPFMADRFRRAGAAARARLDATDGAKAAVADFFIRHGLSVSTTLRVRKLDTCIECYACEQACEDRYGVKRLSLNGRTLGNLDFVDACHTCTDQRCIDPCNFDAIAFDTARREILIKEEACTGCTLCAVACPYNAIEMHELEDTPLLQLRLHKEGKLAFGDGTPRKAKLRRMASKCDHCAFYEDQACISACPTGALLEILPSDAVSQLPEQVRAVARAGFDRTAVVDLKSLNTTTAFQKGKLQLPETGRARAKRAKLKIPLWWAIGLGALAISVGEIVLRKFFPQLSVAYIMATLVEGTDPDVALGRVDYRPGCDLAVSFGYIGTAIMISGLAYVPRRRLAFMRNVGSLRAWFDWHVMSGVVGPLFILLHSALKLDNWISLAFWSMVGTVLSGILGRYLTTQLPERASTAAVETLDVDRQLGELRKTYPGVRSADVWFEAYQRRLGIFEQRLGGKERAPTVGGAVLTFFWVLRDDLSRGRRLRQLRRGLKQTVHGRGARKVRRRSARFAERLALLERRRVLLPRLEPLFRRWKAIHVPMAVTLTIIAAVHITLALRGG